MGKGWSNSTQALIFVIVAPILGAALSSKDSNYTFTPGPVIYMNNTGSNNNTQPPHEPSPAKLIIGGSEKWHFGFNYTLWASQNEPFYVNDTLVFKYDPPNKTTYAHSVYLVPDVWSYMWCDLRRETRVANWTQGGGEGFSYVLQKWKPYFFACGQGRGLHCARGTNFMLFPLLHRPHN